MTAHQLTALAYLFIGGMLLETSFRVWNSSALERPFMFGKYVTADGMRVVLGNIWMLALSGTFIFACGIEHWIDETSEHRAYTNAAVFETVVSWAFALAVGRIWLLARWKEWRGK